MYEHSCAKDEALAAALRPDPLDEAALKLSRQTLEKEKAHLPDPYVVSP